MKKLIKQILEIKKSFNLHKIEDDKDYCGILSVAIKRDIPELKFYDIVEGVFTENGRKMSHIFLLDMNHMMIDPSAGQYGFKVSNGIYIGDFNKCQYFKAKKSIQKISNKMFKYYLRYVEIHDKYKNLSEVELKSKYNSSYGDIDNMVILDLLSKDVTTEQILQQIKK